MSLSMKVLWSEGMKLNVQHIQQLDHYHETRLRHVARAINPYAWGVQEAKWHLEGVGDNALRAQALTVIFRDGEICHAPLCDALPDAIDLGALPMSEPSFVFYAALPAFKAHGGNLDTVDAPCDDARYTVAGAQTPDLYTEEINHSIDYLTKNLRLLSQLDSRDAYECIPVVKVRRRADGSFEIDPDFMAPSLSVDADPAMRELLHSLLGKLSAKSEALYKLQRQPRGDVVEAHSGGASSFWMLSIVNTAHAALSHCATSGHCHPQTLFDKLMTLAGGLMTFSRKYAVTDLPRYNHEQPGPGFNGLGAIIRELLDTVISSKYVNIPLVIDQERTQYRGGRFDATLTDGKARLYLAANADMPALNLVAELPRQLKIASPHDVETLVRSALPGVPVAHLPQVPMEVPVRPDTYYFSIENRGDLYERVMRAQALTIYAPSTLKDLRLELFAITD